MNSVHYSGCHRPKDHPHITYHSFQMFGAADTELGTYVALVRSEPGVSENTKIAQAHRMFAAILKQWATEIESAAAQYE